ncbi:hypothetical protein [Paraburkholderia sp. HP33-1]|uniref:hypothetical protein n=1 Tax=Paraburkholderia sp. HP33-1 TaxID=2883243 RepID=UPI001F23C980|nr:hypothetical protein [Paraburkholderia sp. HP33-1]
MTKQLVFTLLTVLIAVALLLGCIAAVARLWESSGLEVRLPVLAISGVVVLLATLALVSLAFGTFGLSDKSQALALPEGSVRAVIALSLVVLFAILSVFLFESLNLGEARSIGELNEQQKTEFLINNKSMTDIVVTMDAGKYKVTYRDPSNQTSGDFAKQLLVLVGTLVTAVSSFYFGSKSGAVGAVSDGAKMPPIVRSVTSDKPLSVSTPGQYNVSVTGDNLNTVKAVKFVKGSDQISATEVVSNDSLVKCNIEVTGQTPQGAWGVTVIDGLSRSDTRPNAITVQG